MQKIVCFLGIRNVFGGLKDDFRLLRYDFAFFNSKLSKEEGRFQKRPFGVKTSFFTRFLPFSRSYFVHCVFCLARRFCIDIYENVNIKK